MVLPSWSPLPRRRRKAGWNVWAWDDFQKEYAVLFVDQDSVSSLNWRLSFKKKQLQETLDRLIEKIVADEYPELDPALASRIAS